MSDAAWKDLERRVCRALGGVRRGPLGRGSSDCVGSVPFAVEVKRSSSPRPSRSLEVDHAGACAQ